MERNLLEMHIIASFYLECIGSKVIFDGWINLDDVASFAPHINVVQLSIYPSIYDSE